MKLPIERLIARIRKRPIPAVAAAFVCLYVLAGAAVAIGVYRYGVETSLTKVASAVVPLPVSSVNLHPISYYQYRHRGIDFNKKFLQKNKGTQYLTSEEGKTELKEKRRDILDILIEEELVKMYAARERLSVADAEVEAAYKQILEDAGGEDAVLRTLRDDYNWTPAYFKSLLRVNLLKNKIEQHLCKNDVPAVKTLAESVLKKAESGESFVELAKKYSQDEGTASSGGVLPPFGKDGLTEKGDEVDKALLTFAQAAKPGALGVVRSCEGYALVRFEKEENGKFTLRTILLKTPNLPDTLKDLRERSHIVVFLPGYYWDKVRSAVLIKR